ncbi:sensor domain-containing diguanylate cyclase [Shewanella waksmanii]|uniref:sensor domain-containing diguanylate cyclase n=1 Tax=Shewanella waksmanii TaxID=213783 RepID=UPI0004B4A4A5|nr:sensor domain-containing diguanylate cyclase [Shewanella waksmanii]
MTDTEEALALLAAPCTDERFFQRALKALALVTQCRWAAFGRPAQTPGKAEVIAFCDLKQAVPGFQFDLKGSPCETIYQLRYPDTHILYHSNLQQHFPDFQLIKDLGAQSYQAELILDDDGKPLGHILVMDPLPQTTSVKSNEFFRLLAQRIGVEYKRLLMRQQLNMHQEIIATTQHLMSFVSDSFEYQIISQGYETLFGLPREKIIGQHVADIHGKEIFETRLRPLLERSLNGETVNTETVIQPPNLNHPIYLNVLHTPFLNEQGKATGVIISAHNITKLNQLQKQTEYLAYHDSLTGLPNRLSLFNHLSQLLPISSPQRVAVIYLDLDEFKLVNDQHGHHGGDQILSQVGRIIAEQLQQHDFAARIGGDEFVIVKHFESHMDTDEMLKHQLAQLVSVMQQLQLGDQSLPINASWGIHWVNENENDVSTLLSNADTRMYQNKRAKVL